MRAVDARARPGLARRSAAPLQLVERRVAAGIVAKLATRQRAGRQSVAPSLAAATSTPRPTRPAPGGPRSRQRDCCSANSARTVAPRAAIVETAAPRRPLRGLPARASRARPRQSCRRRPGSRPRQHPPGPIRVGGSVHRQAPMPCGDRKRQTRRPQSIPGAHLAARFALVRSACDDRSGDIPIRPRRCATALGYRRRRAPPRQRDGRQSGPTPVRSNLRSRSNRWRAGARSAPASRPMPDSPRR